jgi:hypothetical protein
MEPSTVKKRNGYWPNVLTFYEDWEEFEIAHLATSDGIGIELFSSLIESKKHQNSTLSIHGLFHFFVQDQTLKTSSKKLYLTVVNKECPLENIIQKTNPSKCVT